MLIYILILLMFYILLLNKKDYKALNLSVVMLIIFSAIRNVGIDFHLYHSVYLNLDSMERFDIGCRVIMLLFKSFFNDKYFPFVCFMSIVTIWLIYITVRKESNNPQVSMFLFVLLGFYTKSFNIMKQFLAIAIVFAGLPYLIRKDLKKYLFLVLMAASVHQTALIMIPIYFFSQIKYSKLSLITIYVISIIALLLYDPIFNMFTSFGHYQIYKEYDTDIEAGVGTYLNVIFFNILIIILNTNYKKIISFDNKVEKYFNLISFSIPFLFLALKNVLFYRISLYILIYFIFILPYFKECFTKDSKKIALFVLYIVLHIYYFLNIYYFGGVYPYQTIF